LYPEADVFQIFVGSVVLYYLSCLTFRFSLAFFFLRLVFRPWHRYLVIGSVSTYSAITIGGMFLFIFRCGFPVTAFNIITHASDPVSIEAARVLTYIMTAANAVCDWAFAIIPLWVIVRSRRQELHSRTAVCLPIVLGILGSVVAMVRFPYLAGTAGGTQFFQSSATSVFLSLLEAQIGIMAMSLTTIKPLLAKLEGKTKYKNKTKRIWPRKLAVDVEAANKNLQPSRISTFTPTVDYKDIALDTSILKGIGVLPDLPSEGDDDTLLGSSKTWLSSKSSAIRHGSWNSISQIMYSDDGFRAPKKKTAEVTVREMSSADQTL